jgi:hypothetical protein
VILEGCDYYTRLAVKYTCLSPTNYQEVVYDLRNAKLLKHILDTIPKKNFLFMVSGTISLRAVFTLISFIKTNMKKLERLIIDVENIEKINL